MLVEWIAVRATGDIGFGRIKADTILQGLSAIKAAHIRRFASYAAFDHLAIKQAIAGARRLQGKQDKKKAEPLHKADLQKITEPPPAPGARQLSGNKLNDLHFDTAIKLAFAGFLRTAEVTYEQRDLQNREVFEATKVQRRDVTFAENDEHVILKLRASKSDHNHTGVEIVIARTGEATCPVLALRALYDLDPQPPCSPLFRTHTGPFSRKFYIDKLRARLASKGYQNYMLFAGHSPRRGAAQHAADNGIMDEDIQKLGRWTSQAFKGYFHISLAYKHTLNRRFQLGRSPPFIQTSPNIPE